MSIVLPVHDRPEALRLAVASVCCQTFRSWELLVVDDGSSDATPEVAQELARVDDRIRILRRPNGGPGAARETGRRAMRGELVQYLDSDDFLLPAKLERQVAALDADPAADVAYCRCGEVEADGSERVPAERPSDSRIEAMFPLFLERRWWNTIVPLYRRALTDRVGAWLPLFQEEDWELDCRIAALGPRLAFVDEVLAIHRHGLPDRLSGGGLAATRRLRDRAEAHARILEHARRAGLRPGIPEMERFSRELFLLARQCGEAGLTLEARRLFGLARQAATPARALGLDFLGYRAIAWLVGWSFAARLARRLGR